MENTGTILDSILAVFDAVGEWITGSVLDIMPMFYSNGNLTFLGILGVAGLAFSVVFLMVGIIQRFLHFGG